ncbi:hypothetical protein B296_00002653 [Ensete ventricosum]|uniref:Uncharacterized protein n=1 Tax=Ensete ventricosum TaxID=4639 RepID=A0A427B6H7_ENSVE|nr:hypothetical protein B296_00002653 [Ensete ventricosum]
MRIVLGISARNSSSDPMLRLLTWSVDLCDLFRSDLWVGSLEEHTIGKKPTEEHPVGKKPAKAVGKKLHPVGMKPTKVTEKKSHPARKKAKELLAKQCVVSSGCSHPW